MVQKEKFLIGFIGPVGSGKTYIARILAKKLGAMHVRTDDIRVALRGKGKSYSSAADIATRETGEALRQGHSVVTDFDAVLSKRRRELQKIAKRFGALAVFIQIKTPEKLILARLRRKSYTKNELFRNSKEAIRTYYIRRKLHKKILPPKPDFIINNTRPLALQVAKLLKKLKGP